MVQAESTPADVRLVPAQIDLSTGTNQLIIATITVIVAALAVSFPTLSLGFITTDFSVLHAVSSAANSGAAGFFLGLQHQDIAKLNSGPLGLAWLLIDYLLVRTHAVLWHWQNIVLFAVCTVLTGHIAAQLSGKLLNRLAPAALLWAGLLYAVYPGHIDSVAWVSAQTDLLAAALSLACLFFYLRFRTLRERPYLAWAMVALVLALLTKVQAVTLPVILALVEVLVFAKDSTPLVKRIYFIMPQFLILFFLATLSLVITLPTSGLAATVLHSLQMIASGSAWQGLLFGAYSYDNSLLQLLTEAANSSITQLLLLCYLGALGVAALRLLRRSMDWRIFLFPVVWLLLSLVSEPGAAETISGRTFLFASAPLCISVVLSCLPALDVFGRDSARKIMIIGSLPLVATFGAYLCLSKQQITVWQSAAVETVAVIQDAHEVAKRLPPGQGVLVMQLPPVLGEGDWIRYAFVEPFGNLNRIVQGAPHGVSGNFSLWPQKFISTLRAMNCGAILRRQTESGPISGWAKPEGTGTYEVAFNKSQLKDLEVPDTQKIEATDEALTIYPGKSASTIWLPTTSIDPLKLDIANIQMDYVAEGNAIGKARLVWTAKSMDSRKEQEGRAAIVHKNSGGYVVWLGRYPDWTLSRSITRIGLMLEPGAYHIVIKKLGLAPHTVAVPELALNSLGVLASANALPIALNGSDGATLHFDVSKIKGAAGARLLIWEDKAEFDGKSDRTLYAVDSTNKQDPIFHSDFMLAKEAVTLAPQLFTKAGVHYARAIAIDKDKKSIGLPTEPLSFKFKSQPR